MTKQATGLRGPSGAPFSASGAPLEVTLEGRTARATCQTAFSTVV